MDINVQKPEPQSFSSMQVGQPQSAKNSNTRPLLNDKHLAAPNASINLTKTSSTTTNSSVAQESRSFTFNSSLINKHSSRTGSSASEDRNNAAIAKKEAQKAAAMICQYYMAGIEKYIKNSSPSHENDYFAKIYREHFLQGYQAINFCKYLKPVDPAELAKKKVYLPKKESHKGNIFSLH